MNKKIHIYLGLFFLLLQWFFSLSGLILNHGNWKFTSFWEERLEKKNEIVIPTSVLLNSNPEKSIMRFLKISGEFQKQQQTSEILEFRVYSPGIVRDLHINKTNGTGTEKVLKYNVWGKLRTLHTFNGMDKANPTQSPNWLFATIWRFTMDGIAIGLILICITSWIMWYRVRKEYKMGFALLIISFLFAGYFVFWT